MGFAGFVARRALIAIISFFALTFALFVTWRSYPDIVLISPFINVHSAVPIQIQAEQAKEYLHLNYPVYLQYFGFLINIFTLKWGYYRAFFGSGPVYALIAVALNNTIFLVLSTGLLAYVFYRVFGIALRIKKRIKINRIFTGFIIVAILVAVPILVRAVANWVVIHFSVLARISPSFFGYLGGIYTTFPTHIIIIDSLIHGSSTDFLLYFHGYLIPLLSVSITLAASLILIKRNILADIDSEGAGKLNNVDKVGVGTEQKKYLNWKIRREMFRNSTALVIILIVSSVYSDFPDLGALSTTLFQGFGYYLVQFFVITHQGIFLEGLSVWAFVYIMLITGVMAIIMATLGSIVSGAMKNKHSELLRENLEGESSRD